MTAQFSRKSGRIAIRAALLLLAIGAAIPSQAAAGVLYTFTGITGTIFPFPASPEAFTLTSPSFLNFSKGPVQFQASQLTSSLNCVFVSFDQQPGQGFTAQLEFADKKNNTVVVYDFPQNAFTSLGTFTNSTFGNPSLVSGTLQVTTAAGSPVPEPASALLLALAAIVTAVCLRARALSSRRKQTTAA
jgi:hypothetical protein